MKAGKDATYRNVDNKSYRDNFDKIFGAKVDGSKTEKDSSRTEEN